MTQKKEEERKRPEPKFTKIQGRPYEEVSSRVKRLRFDRPMWAISTEVLYMDEERVVMRSSISDEEGHLLSTGIAEDKRKSMKRGFETSLYEITETSAVGRALAFLGYNEGESLASADEVRNAQAASKRLHEEAAKEPEPAFKRASEVKTTGKNKDDYKVDVWSPDNSTWNVEITHKGSKATVMSVSKLGDQDEAMMMVDGFFRGE